MRRICGLVMTALFCLTVVVGCGETKPVTPPKTTPDKPAVTKEPAKTDAPAPKTDAPAPKTDAPKP